MNEKLAGINALPVTEEKFIQVSKFMNETYERYIFYEVPFCEESMRKQILEHFKKMDKLKREKKESHGDIATDVMKGKVNLKPPKKKIKLPTNDQKAAEPSKINNTEKVDQTDVSIAEMASKLSTSNKGQTIHVKRNYIKKSVHQSDVNLVKSPEPKKVCISAPINSSAMSMAELKQPVGLYNSKNVCFMNCILQVLYTIPPLKRFLSNINVRQGNEVLESLQTFFTNMCHFKPTVKKQFLSVYPCGDNRFDYFTKLKGEYPYQLGTQEDAQEWMNMILDQLYSVRNEQNQLQIRADSPFRIDSKTYVSCTNCTYHSTKVDTESMLTLEISESDQDLMHRYRQSDGQIVFTHTAVNASISELVNRPKSQEGELCSFCEEQQSKRETILSNLSDYLIFHLKFFHISRDNRNIYKLMPNLSVEERIQVELVDEVRGKCSTDFKLHSIVLHTGNQSLQGIMYLLFR